MSKPGKVVTKLRQIATEIENQEIVGKINWSNIMALVMQLLPLIFSFFTVDPTPEV